LLISDEDGSKKSDSGRILKMEKPRRKKKQGKYMKAQLASRGPSLGLVNE